MIKPEHLELCPVEVTPEEGDVEAPLDEQINQAYNDDDLARKILTHLRSGSRKLDRVPRFPLSECCHGLVR